jgi:hypothetical protein
MAYGKAVPRGADPVALSPLARAQQAEAVRQQGQLDRTWHSLQQDDFEDAGHFRQSLTGLGQICFLF